MFEPAAHRLAAAGLLGASLGGYRAFVLAGRDPERVQRRLLGRIIAQNRDTEFGRRQGFASIQSYEDYRDAVPPCEYEDLRGQVERIMEGAQAVLTAEPVIALVPTSGSASATKLIPYTETLLRQFRAAVSPWLASLLLHSPALRGGSQFWITSPHTKPDAPRSAVPVSFIPDAAYLNPLQLRCCGSLMCVPPEAGTLSDTDSFLYLNALFMLRAGNLRLISVWHPSVLSILLDAIERQYDELVWDVREGTISEAAVPDPAQRAMFSPCLEPCPGRAKRLENCRGDFADIWPELAVISCWTEGWSGRSVPSLKKRFPRVEVQPKGLLATEGVVSIPIGPEGSRAAAAASHLLEFEEGSGAILPLWEIETGREYSVLLTTGGGLYRYRLHDRVRVSGFFNRLPALEFLGRDNCLCDLAGEKLHLAHVESVIEGAQRELGLEFDFAMLAPREAGPGYVFYYHAARDPDAAALQEIVERGLCENYHYRHARNLSQLAPVRLFRTGEAPQRAYLERITAGSGGLGDAKLLALRSETDWHRAFTGSFAT